MVEINQYGLKRARTIVEESWIESKGRSKLGRWIGIYGRVLGKGYHKIVLIDDPTATSWNGGGNLEAKDFLTRSGQWRSHNLRRRHPAAGPEACRRSSWRLRVQHWSVAEKTREADGGCPAGRLLETCRPTGRLARVCTPIHKGEFVLRSAIHD